MTTVDPFNTEITIEYLVKCVDQLRNKASTIHLRTQDKQVHPVICLWHMLEAGRIPNCDELSEDDNGNKIISDLDPDTLTMSTSDWEKIHGLQSMGEHCDIVSMYGADLEDNRQAEKLRQAFVKFPLEILSLAIAEMYKKFEELITMDKFTSESSEKFNPLSQMKQMQEVLVSIQNRCANATDEMYKLCMRTAKERPSNLSQLRSLEISLKMQVQIYELGKFEHPGSREDEFAKMLCRYQSKIEGSRFPIATQGAMSNALIKILGERKENKTLLTIKSVMAVIRETHTMMNGVQVGRLTDAEQQAGRERAMYAHAEPKPMATDPKQRNGRFEQRRPGADSEFNTLKQENASLKNQINQLKENLEKLKASVETLKTDATTKSSW